MDIAINSHEYLNELEKIVSGEIKQQEEMCNVLKNLKENLTKQYEQNGHSDNLNKNEHQKRTLKKIESIVTNFVEEISKMKNPVLLIPHTKSWDNCIFNDKVNLKTNKDCRKITINLCKRKSLSKFCTIYFLLGKIYKLIRSGEVCTKRELYYQNIEFINSQTILDSALNEISCLLEVPLHFLNLHSSSKGLIYGPIVLKTLSEEIDCSTAKGTLIPNNVFDISEIITDAKFVLLIEKDAIFQKLITDGAFEKLPCCIFITGKGFPDINTRTILKRIWDILTIPILCLVDPDPWGIEIMCIYRFGSLAMSHQSENLAVPSIRWLGIYPSEIKNLCDSTTELNNSDKMKLNDLLSRPYVVANEKIKKEIEVMMQIGFKAETEDVEICLGYISNKYIPHKISVGEFI